MGMSPCVLHGASCQLHRSYHVFFEPKSGPTRIHDWTAVHEEYDGPGDNRVIYAATLADALARVDEMGEGR